MLPELLSVNSVRNLSDSQSYSYFKAYYPEDEPLAETQDRKNRIPVAIGRRNDQV